jgi:hypothetical protein
VTPLVLQAHQLMDFANDANLRAAAESADVTDAALLVFSKASKPRTESGNRR